MDNATLADRLPDGTRVEKGDVVMRVEGLTQRMLVAERTALNLACHLSGIATATSRWVDALDGSPTRVLDTRKLVSENATITTTATLHAGQGYGIWVRATHEADNTDSGYSVQLDPGVGDKIIVRH